MAPTRKSTKATKGKAGKKGAQLKGRIQKYAPKPKRPANGYAFFVKEFSKGKNLKGKDLIIGASKAWKKLSTKKQTEYKERAFTGIARYKADMVVWREERQFLKKPPHAYGLFVRDFWQAEQAKSSRPLDFGNTSKQCAQAWTALASDGKSAYTGTAGSLFKGFKDSLHALEHGAQLSALIEAEVHGDGGCGVSSKSGDEVEDSDDRYYDSEDEDSDADFYSSESEDED